MFHFTSSGKLHGTLSLESLINNAKWKHDTLTTRFFCNYVLCYECFVTVGLLFLQLHMERSNTWIPTVEQVEDEHCDNVMNDPLAKLTARQIYFKGHNYEENCKEGDAIKAFPPDGTGKYIGVLGCSVCHGHFGIFPNHSQEMHAKVVRAIVSTGILLDTETSHTTISNLINNLAREEAFRQTGETFFEMLRPEPYVPIWTMEKINTSAH